jgi:hypothetical protein
MDRLILSRRVQAASLVEVLVAVVIISLVFSLAIGIYLNVQQSGFSVRKIAADVCLQESMTNAIAEKRTQSFSQPCGDFVVWCEVGEVPDRPGLNLLRWEARDSTGVLLVERKQFMHAQ